MSFSMIKTAITRLLLACSLAATALFSAHVIAADAYSHSPDTDEVSAAIEYLRGEQGPDGGIADFATSAWALMAIVAAGEDPAMWHTGSSPNLVEYLSAHAGEAVTAADHARTLLAIAAAGEDPTDFGGRDFVALLEAEYDDGQLGDGFITNDDFWGVMALVAAGLDAEQSRAITDSVSFLLANQNEDGGWSWGVGMESDVDDTAAAIMALIAAGHSASSAPVALGLDYLKAAQLANGGFESWGATNSCTNAWGICSIVAAGQDPTSATWRSSAGKDPVADLLTFQDPADGSFCWTIESPSNRALMTSYALVALLGVPYPVAVLPPLERQDGFVIDVRIEGRSDTIWAGAVTVTDGNIVDSDGVPHHFDKPTALGALDAAARLGGFSYVLKDMAFGLYVESIAAEAAAGLAGWGFRVNYFSPAVGTADFVLGETSLPDPPHQELLFAYAQWGELPLKLAVDNATPGVGEAFTVTVTHYDDASGAWSPTADATVYAGRQQYSTGEDGTAEISIDRDFTLEVRAQKDGCIRSNRVTVVVGTGSAQSDSNQQAVMTAVIVPAVSLSINPATIDFGEGLGPGDTSSPRVLTVTNTGAWRVQLSAQVQDEAEGLYVDGLQLNDVGWSEFSAMVERYNSLSCTAVLTVPETYQLIGRQDGTLILWATDGR